VALIAQRRSACLLHQTYAYSMEGLAPIHSNYQIRGNEKNIRAKVEMKQTENGCDQDLESVSDSIEEFLFPIFESLRLPEDRRLNIVKRFHANDLFSTEVLVDSGIEELRSLSLSGIFLKKLIQTINTLRSCQNKPVLNSGDLLNEVSILPSDSSKLPNILPTTQRPGAFPSVSVHLRPSGSTGQKVAVDDHVMSSDIKRKRIGIGGLYSHTDNKNIPSHVAESNSNSPAHDANGSRICEVDVLSQMLAAFSSDRRAGLKSILPAVSNMGSYVKGKETIPIKKNHSSSTSSAIALDTTQPEFGQQAVSIARKKKDKLMHYVRTCLRRNLGYTLQEARVTTSQLTHQ